MSWRPKNLSDAILPMGILYAIIGYGIFQYPIGRQRVKFSRAYAIITVFLYYSVLAYNFLFVQSLSWSTTPMIVISTMILANIEIATLAQIISWYYARTFLRILKKLMKVDETLQKLGANINYCRTMNIGILVIIYWLITLVGLNSMDGSNPRFNRNGNSVIVMTLYYTIVNYPIHVNAIISLNFSLALRILYERFYKLNKLIEDSFTSHYQQSRVDNPWSFWGYRNNNINTTLRVSSRHLWQADENLKILIQTVKHVHLELILISKYFNKIYGLPMALETACLFVSFTGLVYDAFEMITGTQSANQEFKIISAIVWAIVPFTNFMVINRSCESVTTEAKRTGRLIHGIDSSIGDSEFHDEIKQFSLQTIKNSVCFSPAGLFNLGYQFVIMFVNSVMTYLVIIIQSDRNASFKLT